MLGDRYATSIGEQKALLKHSLVESTRILMPSERRVKTRCGILLRRAEDQVIVTSDTDNMSDEGFYCKSEQPFSPGDRLECDLFVPTGRLYSDGPNLVLHGCARVLRIEVRGLEPGFGITCEFEDQPVTVE